MCVCVGQLICSWQEKTWRSSVTQSTQEIKLLGPDKSCFVFLLTCLSSVSLSLAFCKRSLVHLGKIVKMLSSFTYSHAVYVKNKTVWNNGKQIFGGNVLFP